MDTFLIFAVLAAGTWLAAAIGAAMVAFVPSRGRVTNLILGFAAGVILMVSFIELLHPAMHMADDYTWLPAWIVVPGAFALGFMGTMLLNVRIGRMKMHSTETHEYKYRRGTMLLGALSVHNIPEGLALGILLGALNGHFRMEDFLFVLPIIIAVGLHKLPEGTAISVAFQEGGMRKRKSFLLGQVSGFIGFLSGAAGFLVAINFGVVLPYAMAFAGGAMIWVATHELIPASKEGKGSYLAAIGVFLGVLLMLFVDTTIHNHKHCTGHSGHDHHHECHHDECHHEHHWEHEHD